VPHYDGLISLLDSRSFGSVWFWIVLIGLWSMAGRTIIGVPVEVVLRARRAQAAGEPEGHGVITLLDWLSLVLPRWHLGSREGALFFGLAVFLLTSLTIFGFRYGLEMAQALTLLTWPFFLLFWMRVRLARQLIPLLRAGQEGESPVAVVATEAIRRMIGHRRLVMLVSILAVALTALWGTLWALMHPYGL
jgi:hypothetical protein